MSFDTALNALPKTRQATVERVLISWETASQSLRNVGRNLKREVHIPPKSFKKFLVALSDVWKNHPDDVVETGRDYEAVCSSFFLLGPKILGKAVTTVGRATQLAGFVDGLFQISGVKDTDRVEQ